MECENGSTGSSTETCTVRLKSAYPSQNFDSQLTTEFPGPISSVTVFGTTIIIINDAKLTLDLLEKRGNLHSSRPEMVFSMEM